MPSPPSSIAPIVRMTSLVGRRFAIPLFCLNLVGISLSAADEDRGGPLQSPNGHNRSSTVKNAIRHPGSATARQGGVGPTSRPVLPPDTGIVRSPGITKPVSSTVASENRAVDMIALNVMQGSILERINYYRAVAGLAPVAAESRLLRAAQFHTQYLNSTDEMGHYEDRRADPYFTGRTPFERIDNQHYDYSEAGEVVARQPSSHPPAAADALMAAIYHRFIILASDFVQGGPGVTLDADRGVEELNVTIDFGAEKLPPLPRPSVLTVYPADGQLAVPIDFDPGEESPNPMPSETLVGYPASIQVDPRHVFVVQSFKLYELVAGQSPREVDTRLLTHSADRETPPHAAALIPLLPLVPSTAYQLMFSGRVDGIAVDRTWRFVTEARTPVTMSFLSPAVRAGGLQEITLHGLDTERGPYYLCYAPARLVRTIVHETETRIAIKTSADCDRGATCRLNITLSYRSCAKPFAHGSFEVVASPK